MVDFEPELGQWGFSNTPWQANETPGWMQRGIEQIDEALVELEGHADDWGHYTSNSGRGEFKNDVFAIRSYCWCDSGKGHEEGCPPNFEHFKSGIQAAWYKHSRRSPSVSTIPTSAEWRAIVRECEDSLALSPGADK